MDFEKYMYEAIVLAQKAGDSGEVPVGCVIIDEKHNIVGRGRNRRENLQSALGHAEIDAIEEACRALGSWRLDNCTLFVTLEPCPMCAGAIINARIPTVVFGASDPSAGSCGSIINLFEEQYGHHPAIYGGILAEECSSILKKFFDHLRKNNS